MRLTLSALILLAMGSCLSTGCKTQGETSRMLSVLKQGRARGHLVVTSDATIGFVVTNGFYLGPKSTSLSFDGDIDFGRGAGSNESRTAGANLPNESSPPPG